MEAIYSGLAAQGGYVLVTNDTFGAGENEGAIARINDHCGAFIVTARGKTLPRVRDVLDKCIANLNGMGNGLSEELAKAIVKSFTMKHREDPAFKENPLPFLLLLVGYNFKQPPSLEHIFVRNRVVKIEEHEGKREYITAFDMNTSVPARNLFFGYAELSEYLSERLPLCELDLEAVKLFAYHSMAETQRVDKSLSPDIRMATISESDGFEWIPGEALESLSGMSKNVTQDLSKRLFECFHKR